MEMTGNETPTDNWLLSSFFNALGFDGVPSLQSAFDKADGVLDDVLEVIETGFRFCGFKELANDIENMQNGNLLARIFGIEAEGTRAAQEIDVTDPAAEEAPVPMAAPEYRM